MTGPRELEGRQAAREFRERERLADLRLGATVDVTWRNHLFHVNVGFYDDGRPGEVFAKRRGEAAVLGAMVDKFCIALSRALQHGCTIDWLCRDVTRDLFGNPETPFDAVLEAVRDLVADVEIKPRTEGESE